MENLIDACYDSDIEKVKELLGKDVDVNCYNYFEQTPINIASYAGYTEIVKLLLNYEKEKVNTHLKDVCGRGACQAAAHCGHTEIVNLLNNYEYFRTNIEEFIPSYNILLSILIKNRRSVKTPTLPNEIILLIKECGLYVCGRELFR